MSAKTNRLRKNISRRQFLIYAGSGLAAGALAACTPAAPTSAPAPAEATEAPAGQPAGGAQPAPAAAAEGKTLVVAVPGGPGAMDMEFSASDGSHQTIFNVCLAPLRFDPVPFGQAYQPDFSQLKPSAAKEWKVAPDSKSITVTLREGALSSAGNELTADDVIYSFERILTLKGISSGLLGLATGLTDPKQVVKEGKYTYTINVDSPNVLLEAIQAHAACLIWDSVEYKKHSTQDDPWSTKWAATNIVGHGAFKVTEFTPGQSWTMERNENYYNPADMTGNVTKINYRIIPSESSRVALIQSGDVDMAFGLGAAALKTLESASGVRVDNLPGNALQWLGFTFGETAPELQDLNVRRAIQLALPYEDLLARPYLGLAQQMYCTVAPIYPGWDTIKEIWTTKQDLAKAKETLAQSKWPTGFNTTLHYDISVAGQEESAILIKSALAQIGINVDLVKLQPSDYNNLAFGQIGFPAMFLYKDFVGTPDPNFGSQLYIVGGHCCAAGKYANEEIDALYSQAVTTIGDLPKRIELQKQIEDIAWNKDPMGAPLQTLGFQMACRSNVTGWWWQSLQEVLWHKASKA